jgi:Glycosyl hydrolase family 26
MASHVRAAAAMRDAGRNRSRSVWVAALVLVGALGSACSSSPPGRAGPPGAATTPSTAAPPSATGGQPPAVPRTGAYLGAWLHPVPAGTGGPAFGVEQQTLPTVQAMTGRPLAVLHIFTPWRLPAPSASLAAVAANGSTPLLDWGCGVSGHDVASGVDDGQIAAFARSLRSFGRPVYLRWCWEMNLVRAHQQVGGPSAFVNAWRHIWIIFHRTGATNVAFVWCPALSGVDPVPYYPGDAYVDWIGVDGYDRSGGTFASLFSAFYAQWVGRGKPMMVAETGAQASDQVAYLDSIATGAPSLPGFKAVVYFDAPGPNGSWTLVGPGLDAFVALAENPYFQP